MTNLLIAEDDALLRQLHEATLRAHFPSLTLVRNGHEALAHLRRHPVDVLVTDWMMPELDGIELIRRVRAECTPPPFIIMSTVLGSKEARDHALGSGADDFLAKPSRPAEIRACIELAGKRHSSSRRLLVPKLVAPVRASPAGASAKPERIVVGVAASTGGPNALHELFGSPYLPKDATYLIALHGPEWMYQSLVEALQRHSTLQISLAEDGIVAQPGTVYFACKDRHLKIDSGLRLRFDASPPEHFLRPAADPLFRSLAQSCGRYALAVVLTGMGSDGSAGAAEVVGAGGVVLVQHPATAVIGAMPSAVIEAGLATEVVPLLELSRAIARHTETLASSLLAEPGPAARVVAGG